MKKRLLSLLLALVMTLSLAVPALARDDTNNINYPLSYSRPAFFDDDGDINQYAYVSVNFMFENNIINGLGNNRFGSQQSDGARAGARHRRAYAGQSGRRAVTKLLTGPIRDHGRDRRQRP